MIIFSVQIYCQVKFYILGFLNKPLKRFFSEIPWYTNQNDTKNANLLLGPAKKTNLFFP